MHETTMATELYEIFKILFKGDPYSSGVAFFCVLYVFLVDKELRGWIGRIESAGKDEKEERINSDDRIIEILDNKQIAETDFKNKLIIELIGKFRNKR